MSLRTQPLQESARGKSLQHHHRRPSIPPKDDIRIILLGVDFECVNSCSFAFVEFGDEHSARNALDGMNGKDLMGRPITISVSIIPWPVVIQ